jgi:dihydropteroate synthase
MSEVQSRQSVGVAVGRPAVTVLRATRPLICGILNVTPDSFSDGGRFLDSRRAIAHGLELARQGADLIDIGGESTRPGAQPPTLDEELNRVVPVVQSLARLTDVPLSVDTSRPEVMCEAVRVGASMINDVRALRMPGALGAAAELA